VTHPNLANIGKKRVHDSLERVNGNSGPNILFIKVIVINWHKNPHEKHKIEREDRDLPSNKANLLNIDFVYPPKPTSHEWVCQKPSKGANRLIEH
jgi:hypothetical protein